MLLCIAPALSPSNLTLVSKSSTSIALNWTHADTSDVDGYIIHANSNVYKIDSSVSTNVTLEGLMPGTPYSIRVRAYQDIIGPASISLNVTTDESK